MAIEQFKPISWTDGEPYYLKKLQAMTSNDQWLYENIVRTSYNHAGVKKLGGLKIAAGTAFFPPFTSLVSEQTIEFAGFFSSACRPVIVTGGVVTPVGDVAVAVGSRGLGSHLPDYRGFVMITNRIGGSVYSASLYIPWIAVGF